LLKAAVVHQPASLDELLESGDDLLDDPNEDIFTMKIARAAPAKPELVSERAPCLDFEKFRPMFDKAAAQLASGERKSMKFAKEQEIEAGGFFILNGLMVYVAEVRDPHIRNGKRNARLRLIFDNRREIICFGRLQRSYTKTRMAGGFPTPMPDRFLVKAEPSWFAWLRRKTESRVVFMLSRACQPSPTLPALTANCSKLDLQPAVWKTEYVRHRTTPRF
jgi:hypothetical protein